MAKLKTNKAARKRFKVTKAGRVKRAKAYKRHILTSKRRKNKRNLRKGAFVAAGDMKKFKALMPYG